MRDNGDMLSPSVPLAGLLADRAAWKPVAEGEADAIVLRHESGERYAKIISHAGVGVGALEAERDRVEWLSGTGVPGPSVLGWRATEHGACLITSAVVGVPADQLTAAQLAQAWPAICSTLNQLHSIPVDSCQYGRTLEEMMALARATVAEDRVHPEFLPRSLADTPPTAILASLERDLPLRREQEAADAVVCHGDFCLPNIVIDTDTWLVAGLIDLGRLGRADPYADIALLLANARETWPDEEIASHADRDFSSRYGITLAPDRMDFYLGLDPLTW